MSAATTLTPVRFEAAREEVRFGGKAVRLGEARLAGLPVPPGHAIEVALVEALVAGDRDAIGRVEPIFQELGPRVAVRSSAVGEDSAHASFAGQHLTVLNVDSFAHLLDAVRAVHASAHTDAVRAYREKLGVQGEPRIAVAVQQFVASEVAGVMVTRNPVSGADERAIEASWGLGEAIVAGLVVPDAYRIARTGQVLARIPGDKNLEFRPALNGGTEEVIVDPQRASALCLDDAKLARLHALALECERWHGRDLDIEWAFAAGELVLLQCRALTTRGAPPSTRKR